MDLWHWEYPGEHHHNAAVWILVSLLAWGAVGVVLWAVVQ